MANTKALTKKEEAGAPAEITGKTVVPWVEKKVKGYLEQGVLMLPENYSPDNALKLAYLILQKTVTTDKKPVLEFCTAGSIANALLDMIVQGLNPGKKQCDFIAYGNQLTCQRSYFGAMATTKSIDREVDDFAYKVVYKDDDFEFETVRGKDSVTEHKQKLENVAKDKIKGAYCIIFGKDGTELYTEIMTIDQIHQSWKQSKMKPFDEKGKLKASSTHGKFPAEMALRTVINKACKIRINASDDSSLVLDAMKRNSDIADRAEVETEIDENANSGSVMEIGSDPGEVVDAEFPGDEKEQKEPVGSIAHPGWDLCIEERGCIKFEKLTLCPKAGDEEKRKACVDFKKTQNPKKEKGPLSGTIKCPKNNAVVARVKCETCDMRKDCPELEDSGQENLGPDWAKEQ